MILAFLIVINLCYQRVLKLKLAKNQNFLGLECFKEQKIYLFFHKDNCLINRYF